MINAAPGDFRVLIYAACDHGDFATAINCATVTGGCEFDPIRGDAGYRALLADTDCAG